MEKQDFLFAPPPCTHAPLPLSVFRVSDKNPPQKWFDHKVLHWHRELQFFFVKKGSMNIRTLNAEYFVNAGEGIFINKNTLHCMTECELSNYVSILFPDTLIMNINNILRQKFVLPYTNNDAIDVIIVNNSHEAHCSLKKLVEIVSQKNDDFLEVKIISAVHSLWHSLIPYLATRCDKNTKATINRKNRLYKVLSYIHEHFNEHITLDKIALSCSTSKSELLRLFKVSLDVSPYKYLIDLRIKKSTQWLIQSDLTVAEISTAIGYTSQSQFGKHFKERLGVSPLKYRQNENFYVE